MKRVFMSLAIAAMMMTAVACGNNANKKVEDAVEDAATEVEEAAEAVDSIITEAVDSVAAAAEAVTE